METMLAVPVLSYLKRLITPFFTSKCIPCLFGIVHGIKVSSEHAAHTDIDLACMFMV